MQKAYQGQPLGGSPLVAVLFPDDDCWYRCKPPCPLSPCLGNKAGGQASCGRSARIP